MRTAREAPEPGDDGFAALLEKVSRERGFACASYKERCLRRRVGVRMRARGVTDYGGYASLLDEDPGEYDRLMDALTINVTRLFRNTEAYDAIAARVVPALWTLAAHEEVRIWSAGCATGHEPYSIAALLHRHAEASGAPARLARMRIVATDVDAAVLATAERAEFEEADFADTPPALRRRYFGAAPPFTLDPALRRMVTFRRGDLLSSPPPLAHAALILCRNVLIYFDRPSQERVFATFHRALAPGGFLVLGKVETLVGAARSLFTAVNVRERIYQRA